MGFYIQGPPRGKADFIARSHGAKPCSQKEAEAALASGKGVVCVVDNGLFEAAGFCFSPDEFDVFTRTGDSRPKAWLVMDRQKAEELSGYKR